ncbi:MAG: hypothetical protein ACTHU0_23160 [Kofleriaceae bacterium]
MSLARFERFDRRWIFLAMALAIVVPLYLPIGLPVKPSPMTKAAFNVVEELRPGDVVFVSMDLEPASTPELEPYYRALMLQLKRKNVRIVFGTLWYTAPPLIERWLRETIDVPLAPAGTPGYSGPPDRAYVRNVDYAYLGFREGQINTMVGMATDLRRVFDGRTDDGTPLDRIPWLASVRSIADFKLLISISAIAPGAKEWVQYVQSRYRLRMLSATTAVSTTDLAPYYQSGQLLGLVAGLSGAAEYEVLVGRPGIGVAGADVLNIGHAVVILAIVLGNAIYFIERRRRRGGKA